MRAANPLWAVVGLSLLVPAGAVAQEDDETAYIYASYYDCGPGQSEAVASLRDDWGPLVQARMDAGTIGAWGILTHDTGNEWSLGVYHVGPDLGAMNDALDEDLARYREENPEAGARFSEICPSHVDYIWTSGPGSEAGAAIAQERQSAGMSVYYVCDEGREPVADLIVEQVVGPALDRQVQEGRINGWGWLSHFVGGEYRRLLSIDGPDHASILEARNQWIEETGEEAALMAEFNNVCNGHTDVLWDIVLARP
jgi:hypothetical protein